MAIGPSQAKFSIPPPPWNTDMSLGQRTQHFKARYINTAFEKPVAYNFFWLQQNKSLFQKVLEKTSSTLIDLRYIKCSWYIAVNFLLFYKVILLKWPLRKIEQKIKSSHCLLLLENFMRSKWSTNWNESTGFFFWSGFFFFVFPPLPFKYSDLFQNQNLKRVEVLSTTHTINCTAENTTRYDFRTESIFPKHPLDLYVTSFKLNESATLPAGGWFLSQT